MIQSLWIGTVLSPIEHLAVQSFLTHGHAFHLYVYGDVQNCPSGVTLRDAREILPEARIFRYQSGFGAGSLAGFSNLFRYHLLNTRGGWWVDMDVVCLRPFPATTTPIICSTFETGWGETASNCILHLPAGHAIASTLVSRMEAMDLNALQFAQSGPLLVQQALRDLAATSFIAPWWEYCPVQWRFLNREIFSSNGECTKALLRRYRDRWLQLSRRDFERSGLRYGSRAVHLFNEIWHQSGWRKDTTYHSWSTVERLKRRYGVTRGSAG